MASPLPTGKQSVNLSGPVRVSRIRRDPPPPEKGSRAKVRERDERDRVNAAIGIAAFAMALLIILIGLGNVAGWSPGQYTLTFAT